MHWVLSGTSVTLRVLRKKYFSQYLAKFSPAVRTFLHISSLETERIYLQESFIKQSQGKTLFYCIFDTATMDLIGGIEIRDDRFHGKLYSWVHEQCWGCGYYQEALALITQEYFSCTDSNFLDAYVDASNKRSYYALKKFGFADAGIYNGPYGKQYILWLRRTRV